MTGLQRMSVFVCLCVYVSSVKLDCFLFTPVFAIQQLQHRVRGEKRAGKRSTGCEDPAISNLPLASISSLFLSCNLAKHGENIIFGPFPQSMGAQKAIVWGGKIVTIESLAILIKICIGNATTARKAIFLGFPHIQLNFLTLTAVPPQRKMNGWLFVA